MHVHAQHFLCMYVPLSVMDMPVHVLGSVGILAHALTSNGNHI